MRDLATSNLRGREGHPSYDWAMTVGTPLLAALEAFYAAPVEDIAKQLASRLDTARARESDLGATLDDLRAAEFLTIYLSQIQQVPVDDWLDGLDESVGSERRPRTIPVRSDVMVRHSEPDVAQIPEKCSGGDRVLVTT